MFNKARARFIISHCMNLKFLSPISSLDPRIAASYGRKLWGIFCGNFDHIVVDIVRRPVAAWMLEGDYSSDREYRSRFHQWLSRIWEEKDQRIESLLEESSPHLT